MVTEFLRIVTSNPAIQWLIAGLFIIATDLILRRGSAFSFAGIAAFAVAAMIGHGDLLPDDYWMQICAFGFFSALWTLLLWKPMEVLVRRIKKYRNGERK
jgi:membrane protein implicated in regulation of membrane protease activity